MTEPARKLAVARRRARLQLRQLAAGIGVHPRTVSRWEIGETQPTAAQWSKAVAYLAQHAQQEALELAHAAGVPFPIAAPPPVHTKLIEEALMRAADMLDVSPRRIRAAMRELAKATVDAGGTLEDLARAAEETAPAM